MKRLRTPASRACFAIASTALTCVCYSAICCSAQENGLGPQAPEAALVADAQTVALGTSGATLQAPAAWVRTEPRSPMIAAEFAIPKSAGDPADGRVTIMSAGGSVDANIKRWVGQFQAAQAGETVTPKIEKQTLAGQEVHLVDLSGTYLDSTRGPFGPKVERPSYRMLAAIIVLRQGGQHFVKLYGPRATIDRTAPAFKAFLGSLTLATAAQEQTTSPQSPARATPAGGPLPARP